MEAVVAMEQIVDLNLVDIGLLVWGGSNSLHREV